MNSLPSTLIFGAGQLLDKLLDDRPLGGAIGAGIIYQGVVLGRHLGNVFHHLHVFQHLRVGADGDGAQVQGLAALDGQPPRVGLETHVGNAYDKVAVLRGSHPELAAHVGHGVGY